MQCVCENLYWWGDNANHKNEEERFTSCLESRFHLSSQTSQTCRCATGLQSPLGQVGAVSYQVDSSSRQNRKKKRRVYAFIYRMIRDEPLGWTEIPLNRVQYGSDYAQGSEKWHHLSTLRRTGEEMFCYVCFSNCLCAVFTVFSYSNNICVKHTTTRVWDEVQIMLLISHFRRELPVTGQRSHRPTIRVRCWGNFRIGIRSR